MLLFVRGLYQDEEVVQAQQFAHPLVQAAASQQPVLRVVDDEQLVDVVGEGEDLAAWLDDEGRVAGFIILLRTGFMSHQNGQVTRKLVNPVDSSNVDRSSALVDSQVVECPVPVLGVESAEQGVAGDVSGE